MTGQRINVIDKIVAAVVFSVFVSFGILVFVFGEGIMFGHRVSTAMSVYALAVITISSLSMHLIYKDRPIGSLMLGLTVVITFIIYFGHRILLWPCDYCDIMIPDVV